jgi:hypothetical protein
VPNTKIGHPILFSSFKQIIINPFLFQRWHIPREGRNIAIAIRRNRVWELGRNIIRFLFFTRSVELKEKNRAGGNFE